MNFIPELKLFYVEFENYVRPNCLKPKNPFNNKIIYEYKHKIKEILEIFFEILDSDILEERLENFGSGFKSAFKSYYRSERNDIGTITNSLDILNIRYEVFLKIIVYLKYQGSNFWRNNFPNLMVKVFDLNNSFLVDINKTEDEFWSKKNAVEAMNRYAFKYRQISTHEARSMTSAQREIIFQNLISLYLIGVDKNFDVLKRRISSIEEKISFYEVIDKQIIFKSLQELECDFDCLDSVKFSSTGSLLSFGVSNFTLGSASTAVYNFDDLKYFIVLYGYSLTFSPDDREVICCQHAYVKQGTRELIVRFNIEDRIEIVDLRSQRENVIFDTEKKGNLPHIIYDLDWSPCGKYLAISSGEFGFYIMNLRDKTIIKACNLDVIEGKWSHEGDRLIITVNKGTYKNPYLYKIYVLSFPTYKTYEITRSKNSETSPSWSPDGKFIVFSRESKDSEYKHIYITEADGKGKAHQLTSGKNYNFSPSWSPRGSSIINLRIDDEYLDLEYLEKMGKVSVNEIKLKKIF